MRAQLLPNGKVRLPVPLYGTPGGPDEEMVGEGTIDIGPDDPRYFQARTDIEDDITIEDLPNSK